MLVFNEKSLSFFKIVYFEKSIIKLIKTEFLFDT
jgi:hypothetical protein